jgi:WD40 repeat protein
MADLIINNMSDVKNFRIITLGPSGAGKTVFLGSLFKQLSTQGKEGFFLEVSDARKIRELNKIYAEVVTGEKWPSGTRNVAEWTFDCCVKNAALDQYKVCEFTYIDYAGGLLTDVQEDGDIFLDFQQAVPNADAVLAIIDGLKLYKFMEDEGLCSKDVLIWMHKELPSIMQLVHRCHRDTPVHFIISKWDLLACRYSIEQVLNRMLEKIPQFYNVVSSREKAGCSQRLIPVSSVGNGFATLQADGSMSKNIGAVPVPFQVDIPLACILLDRVSAYLDILKRYEADAAKTTQIKSTHKSLDRLTGPYVAYQNVASATILLDREVKLQKIANKESAVDYMVSIFFNQLKQFERTFPAANLGGKILPELPSSRPISPRPVEPVETTVVSRPLVETVPSVSTSPALVIAQQASLIHTFRGHKKAIRSVGFTASGQTIFSSSNDKSVRFWNATSGRLEGMIQEKASWVTAQLSPDDERLFTASQDKSIKIWNAKSGRLTSLPLKKHTDWVTALAITPDATQLVSGGRDHTINLWRLHDKGGQLIQTLESQQGFIYALAISTDGKIFASGGNNHRILLWDLAESRILKILDQSFTFTRALAFSPTEDKLAVAGQAGGLCLWDISMQNLLFNLEGHSGSILSIDISPDGRMLVSAGEDATVKLWDLENRKLMTSLDGHRDRVNSVKFSPDGQNMVSGSDDATIKVWQLV